MKGSVTQVMKIIWGALLVSLILYVVISLMKLPSGQSLNLAGLTDFTDPLRVPLIMAAFMSLMLAVMVPKILLTAIKKKRTAREPLELPEMARLFYVPFIIRLALLESVTLYGFVLVQTKNDPAQILPFFAASLLGFLLNFPSESNIRTAFV